jgi:hypothetical protein
MGAAMSQALKMVIFQAQTSKMIRQQERFYLSEFSTVGDWLDFKAMGSAQLESYAISL